MSSEVVAALLLGGSGLLIVLFFLFALRKARRRRMEEMAEPGSPAAIREREEREAQPGSPEPADPGAAPGPESEPEPQPKPNRKSDSESAPEPEPLPEVVAEPERGVPEPEPEPEPAPPRPAQAGEQADREAISQGLSKTRESFLGKLNSLFGGGQKVDGAVLDELEEVLLTADVGVSLTMQLIDQLRDELSRGRLDSPAAVRSSLREKMTAVVTGQTRLDDPLAVGGGSPRVILFVGVNGVGKTTTIGKIATKLTEDGQSVVMAAGDTFRAAASEQLGIWAERSGARLIRGDEGSDPASVIFNAIKHAQETGADYVLADTAGRLHTKAELMDEIKKVKRAASKARDGAPDATWLVIDATTGQNGLQQANEFNKALELSGVVLTKLDGTAKGGVVVAIAQGLGIPVQYVGVGEKPTDLRPFDAKQFVDALFDAA